MNLFCLPYAGGSSAVYSSWKRNIADFITIYPVELAGRGARMSESFYNSMEEGVEDIYIKIKEDLEEKPYALFGHSMGGLMAYELYHKIVQERIRPPKLIIISGVNPPNYPEFEQISGLPEESFIEKLKAYQGTPEELFNHKELMNIFLPVLRADFRLVETYQYKKKNQLIDIDTIIFNGEFDTKTKKVQKWEEHIEKSIEFFSFKGNHFFINECFDQVIQKVNSLLANAIITK